MRRCETDVGRAEDDQHRYVRDHTIIVDDFIVELNSVGAKEDAQLRQGIAHSGAREARHSQSIASSRLGVNGLQQPPSPIS